MKRPTITPLILASFLVFGVLAFAIFMLLASGQLNVATLRSIDGPLDAQQLASMQLCNVLNIAAGSMICGTIFTVISMIVNRGKHQTPTELT